MILSPVNHDGVSLLGGLQHRESWHAHLLSFSINVRLFKIQQLIQKLFFHFLFLLYFNNFICFAKINAVANH